MSFYSDIPGSNDWSTVYLINKGWSNDKKYRIKTSTGEKILLRISSLSEYDSKKKDYNSLKRLRDYELNISKVIDFGLCNDGKEVYMLLTWVDGNEAEKVIPTLSNRQQYDLGVEAGEILRKLHQVSPEADLISWEDRFNSKIDRNINRYECCNIKFEGAEKIINYINNNRDLLKGRKQSFQHGDYHVGNLLVSDQGELGVIDFNRLDYGDPWEEFNRITWCVSLSKYFASGYINGYFNHSVPDKFFRLMALYIGSNQLSSIPWAIPFGQAEVNVMLQQARDVLCWYSDFEDYVPNWYMERFKEDVVT